MIVKAVSFFLIGIVVLAMFGRLRMPKPKLPTPKMPGRKRADKIADAHKCPACGGYVLNGAPCNCGHKGS